MKVNLPTEVSAIPFQALHGGPHVLHTVKQGILDLLKPSKVSFQTSVLTLVRRRVL